MYPYDILPGILPGIDLYTILITVGVVVCLLLLRWQGDRRNLSAKVQNFILIATPLSVVLGYLSAILFQGLYNIASLGRFELSATTGATFYGGLFGGVTVFVLLYFLVGPLTVAREKRSDFCSHFLDVLDIAPAAITAAHGFGRLGCLMAGCCHGRETDAWYGVTLANGQRVVPVPLLEALFLFALCGVLMYLVAHGKRNLMPVYMLGYGVWRFLIEYARGDERGDTLVDFLSPSQLFSIFMIIGGVVLFLVVRRLWRRVESKEDVRV